MVSAENGKASVYNFAEPTAVLEPRGSGQKKGRQLPLATSLGTEVFAVLRGALGDLSPCCGGQEARARGIAVPGFSVDGSQQ